MHISYTIIKIGEQKGPLQNQVTTQLRIGQTNYHKLENCGREPSIKEL